MKRRRRRRRYFFPGDGRERRRAADAAERLRKPSFDELRDIFAKLFADAMVPVFTGVQNTVKTFVQMGDMIREFGDQIGKAIPVLPAEFVSIPLTMSVEKTDGEDAK